jgi:squalene-hopene/tetraprenyl-beta-curcumene cyclase
MRTLALILALALVVPACGGDQPGKPGIPIDRDALAAYDAGLDYLKTQAKGGHFGNPGFTAIATTPFLTRPGGVRDTDTEFVEGCVEYLLTFQQEDGGIYDKYVANYTTCVSIMALAAADKEKYGDAIAKAAGFVKSLQAASGGIGYSDKVGPEDPDMSNTQFAVEAIKTAGVELEDRQRSKLLEFLQRNQNRTETNDGDYKLQDGRRIVPMNDGGAYYKPTESKAGTVDNPDGTVSLRSYGSTTYALLKCYILAGLSKDDGRVKDAVKWISTHFTLAENPGFEDPDDPKAGMQGYYYYLMTVAKALRLLDVEEVKDADGVTHDWRKELTAELLSRQMEDGSWVNSDKDRWMEGMPQLATAYALTALSSSMQ